MLKVQAVWIIPDVNYDISLGGNKSKSVKKREMGRGSNSPKRHMFVLVIAGCMITKIGAVELVIRLCQSCQTNLNSPNVLVSFFWRRLTVEV